MKFSNLFYRKISFFREELDLLSKINFFTKIFFYLVNYLKIS